MHILHLSCHCVVYFKMGINSYVKVMYLFMQLIRLSSWALFLASHLNLILA